MEWNARPATFKALSVPTRHRIALRALHEARIFL
jgi:hypothetical protein